MNFPFVKDPNASKDIIGSYNFKDHYPDVNRNMAWGELAPYMRQAITLYILPYIGQTLWDDITSKIQNPPNGFPDTNLKQDVFVEKLRDVVAHYTIAHCLPKKKTLVASMGAMTNNATEGTTVHPLWAFRTTLWSVTKDADRLLDELLGWMENKVEDGNNYFVSNWKETAVYDEIDGFFRHTKDFQQYWPIHRSLRSFRQLVPIIQEQAEAKILKILCQDQYQALLTAIQENDDTPNTLKLIGKVRRTLANWTIFEATEKLPFLPDNNAYRVISNTDAIDQRSYGQQITAQAIVGMRESAQRNATRFEQELISFMYSNQDDYPLWKDSSCNLCGDNGFDNIVISTGKGGVML